MYRFTNLVRSNPTAVNLTDADFHKDFNRLVALHNINLKHVTTTPTRSSKVKNEKERIIGKQNH